MWAIVKSAIYPYKYIYGKNIDYMYPLINTPHRQRG